MSDENWLEGEDAKPQEPQWVKWYGHHRAPINGHCEVEVKLRCGDFSKGPASTYDWTHEDDGMVDGDIIAYRVLKWHIDLDQVFERPKWESNPLPDDVKICASLTESSEPGMAGLGVDSDRWSWHIGMPGSIVKYRIISH